jgi:hypothetical protein
MKLDAVTQVYAVLSYTSLHHVTSQKTETWMKSTYKVYSNSTDVTLCVRVILQQQKKTHVNVN